jgi:hypothetical protein
MTELGEFGMWMAIGAGQLAAWFAVSPIIKALAERISRRGQPASVIELEARLAALEQRGMTTGEVELQQARLAELEERLDFAERLLAQRESAKELRA